MTSRLPLHVFVCVFAITLVLTGCQAETEAGDTPTPTDATEQTRTRWDQLASDEGSALVLLGEGDRQIFHMACLRADREIQIIASDFTIIGSEERMTMGLDNDAYGFVADTEWTNGGVMARTAIEPSVLDALSRTDEVSVIYGVQQGGPWPAPSVQQRAAFIEGCNGIAVAPAADAAT